MISRCVRCIYFMGILLWPRVCNCHIPATAVERSKGPQYYIYMCPQPTRLTQGAHFEQFRHPTRDSGLGRRA
ncbi:hypothetical protein B484DRAFT_115500 [Ochromonadaceae sp. CCMP2298]|nr:hypothetical protein B484DRAFT_115500 [Ochromonadaceae sp. CCMP2298]